MLQSMIELYLAAAPSSEVSTLIVEILEEWYFDGIETLVSAELKGDKIVGEFTDQVGPRQVKRFKYEISEESVQYWLLNGKETQGFSAQMFRKPLFGRGSRAGQKKKCTKGVPCGDSCQTAAPNKDGSPRRCSKQPGSATQAKIKALFQKMTGEEAAFFFNEVKPFKAFKVFYQVTAPKLRKAREVEWRVHNDLRFVNAFNQADPFGEGVEINNEALDIIRKQWNKTISEISFLVDRKTENKRKTAAGSAIARAIRRQWPEVLEQIPEGTILTNRPVGGFGGKRAKIYSRMGFSEPDELTGYQVGIVEVKDGKKVVSPLQIAKPGPKKAPRMAAGHSDFIEDAPNLQEGQDINEWLDILRERLLSS